MTPFDTLTQRLQKAERDLALTRRALTVAKIRITLLHGALAHAVHRGHDHSPDSCDACADAARVLDQHSPHPRGAT